MEAKPKPFNVKLTEAERAALEAHRAHLGLRSHADVVRHWILQPVFPEMPLEERQRKMASVHTDSLDLPFGNIKGPMQKKGKAT